MPKSFSISNNSNKSQYFLKLKMTPELNQKRKISNKRKKFLERLCTYNEMLKTNQQRFLVSYQNGDITSLGLSKKTLWESIKKNFIIYDPI